MDILLNFTRWLENEIFMLIIEEREEFAEAAIVSNSQLPNLFWIINGTRKVDILRFFRCRIIHCLRRIKRVKLNASSRILLLLHFFDDLLIKTLKLVSNLLLFILFIITLISLVLHVFVFGCLQNSYVFLPFLEPFIAHYMINDIPFFWHVIELKSLE